MRVEHFRVSNFTSLVDVDLPNLPNLVVFIGKNSTVLSHGAIEADRIMPKRKR